MDLFQNILMKFKKSLIFKILAGVILATGIMLFQKMTPNIADLFQKDLSENKTPLDQMLEKYQDWTYIQFGSCGGIEHKNQTYLYQLKLMTPKAELMDLSPNVGSLSAYFKALEGIYKHAYQANPDCDQIDLTLVGPNQFYSLRFKIDSEFKLASTVKVEVIKK